MSGTNGRTGGAARNPRVADFPLLAANPALHYLDSAATTQKPAIVLDAMRAYYERDNANPHRGGPRTFRSYSFSAVLDGQVPAEVRRHDGRVGHGCVEPLLSRPRAGVHLRRHHGRHRFPG